MLIVFVVEVYGMFLDGYWMFDEYCLFDGWVIFFGMGYVEFYFLVLVLCGDLDYEFFDFVFFVFLWMLLG